MKSSIAGRIGVSSRRSKVAGVRCSRSFEVLTVVDLGVGNLASLASALRFLGADFQVSASPERVANAPTLILPGVGSFDAAVHSLEELDLRRPILERIAAGVPTLGICIGMQLLFLTSEEGSQLGLGVFSEPVVRLGRDQATKVPHVGFDTVRADSGTWLSQALGPTPDFYFTHSFAADDVSTGTVGRCDYDGGFVAAVERWPVVGAQFHPEKSQSSGLAFLAAFIRRARGRT
jgi:imidazole glycerol-phosphate synthase subunit HisH